MTAIMEGDRYAATNAPESAPRLVAISRNIPTRMFEYPSRTYAAAAPDEVAMTETSDAPTAYRRSTPRTMVSSGTITTPPPSPVREPRNPAASDAPPTTAVNSATFIQARVLDAAS